MIDPEQLLAYPKPRRRALQIYAADPMMARLAGNEIVTITVPYEPLQPGPSGRLLQVIDYDASVGTYYTPVDLDDRVLLAQDGLTPSEGEPRFHQQMVYAVISSLLENVERGLGRRLRWRGYRPLRILPHAFAGENALYDPAQNGSLRFGYFRTNPNDPGRNLPGQFIFSCLSHDIIVHEASHALMDRLRIGYRDATNWDVSAFHEGFADAVALFQHFTLPDLLAQHIQQNQADLRTKSSLIELAQQFGEGSGLGGSLRDALDEENPDSSLLSRVFEPHDRGGIFVAAIFDAYFAAYQAAIADLIRIATAGTGRLPPGALHPDLVARVGGEARQIAQRLLMICLRAFQYLPPVDVTFGDFLRSAVTADRDLFPGDEFGLRARLVESFRKRGIYPAGVSGLADEAVAWRTVEGLTLEPLDSEAVVTPLVMATAQGYRATTEPVGPNSLDSVAKKLNVWARRHAAALGLQSGLRIKPEAFHAVFRLGGNGLLQINLVIQFLQTAGPEIQAQADQFGGIEIRGGATVVADVDGTIRHVISKPTPVLPTAGAVDSAVARLRGIGDFVDQFDSVELPGPWRSYEAKAKWPTLAYRQGWANRVASTLSISQLDREGLW